jgi:hypothetical protein
MLIVIEYTHAAMDGFLREDDAANSIPTHWVSSSSDGTGRSGRCGTLGGEWEERLPLMARARTTSGRWRTGFVHGFVIYGWLLSLSLLSLLSSAEDDRKMELVHAYEAFYTSEFQIRSHLLIPIEFLALS